MSRSTAVLRLARITQPRAWPGHDTHRTTAPALVRLARSKPAAEAGFVALILLAGFALDGAAGVVLTVLENFTK